MFGIELGAVTIQDDEKDSYIIKGKFSAEDFATKLDGFIENFVLCGSCRNPETIVNPSKTAVKLRCISCGNETVCPKNKMSEHIQKDWQRRKIKAKQEHEAAAAAAAGAAGKKKSGKTKKGADGKTEVDDGEDDNADWSVDVSSTAVKERRRAALGIAAVPDGATGAESAAPAKATPEEELKQLVAATGPLDMDKLRQLRDALRLSPAELAFKICGLLFTDNIMKEIIPLSARWGPFFLGNPKAQDSLISVVVDLALNKEEVLLPHLATIFKGLYDKDFLEEENILEWYDGLDESDTRLLKAKLKLAPFATWLRSAEESSEE